MANLVSFARPFAWHPNPKSIIWVRVVWMVPLQGRFTGGTKRKAEAILATAATGEDLLLGWVPW